MNRKPEPASCSSPACGCHAGIARRDFLKLGGLAATAAAMAPWQAVAGPFEGADFEKLVPADKRLGAGWIRSLFARGEPEVWRGAELGHVGMPIGGICAGQLYLGGDGKLWHWDIFKSNYSSDYGGLSSGIHYSRPPKPESALEQGFAVKVVANGATQVRELDARGFQDIAFRGEYPMARVEFRDAACPLRVDLEAFTPFVPLDPESSGLPATILEYTLTNPSGQSVEVELAGWLENKVCPENDMPSLGVRRNRLHRTPARLSLECSAEAAPARNRENKRGDIRFDDFEQETYQGWTTQGTAFGAGPVAMEKIPSYQGDVGGAGRRVVNSHASAPGADVGQKDSATGTLSSKPFAIERDFITFLIGGGNHPGKTCVNLVIEGKIAATAAGQNSNRMRTHCFDVTPFAGKTARLEIVDAVTGGWGNIGVDEIVFTDNAPTGRPLENLPGYGSMALSLLQPGETDTATTVLQEHPSAATVFDALQAAPAEPSAARRFGVPLVGALGRKLTLAPGRSAKAVFLVTWFFPNYPTPSGEFAAIADLDKLHRHYALRFGSAGAVAAQVAQRYESLAQQTRLWNRTWYDSTLPYWFLDRAFITLDTLATQTCHRFDSGRFYGWEGVDCCPGTCQHVWQYAQAMARVFPQLERDLRERVDFGLSWHPNGAMDYRGESGREVAHDGFAGTILRVYREHCMSADAEFLKRLWPRVKKSIEFLLAEDKDGDGLLEGRQYNTLDAAWYGPMGWLSSLFLAAIQAGRAMAMEMGDADFARVCLDRVQAGSKNLVAQLFNGEYFIHRPDPKHPEAINTNAGCHIDQVFGQSFAWQVGLERVVPREQTLSALRSLWRYNFTPDIGPYRKNFAAIKAGRWYAMPGEGGLLMCTWPKGGAETAPGKGRIGRLATSTSA